jgi:hypothetical protein
MKNVEEYLPKEFQLMLGELKLNSQKLFEIFINDYYENS